MQRIPQGHSGEGSGERPSVLLQHGLLMDGITWLLSPPEQFLALLLADNGFDVWITNTRGTKYSQGHTSLSPDDDAYWDWSWDQLVAYDLPATVQYVHDQAGQKTHYVGHSLGTLIALAAFSQDPSNEHDEIRRVAKPNCLCWSADIPACKKCREAVIYLLKAICSNPGIGCTDLLTSFTGKNCCLNSSVVDVFLEHEPQATATKNMIHNAQMIRSGTITKYDYEDEDQNRQHYG